MIYFLFSSIGIPDTTIHMKKYNELMYLLEDIESEITEKWLHEIPHKIEINLNKNLFIVHSNDLLELNFTDEV